MDNELILFDRLNVIRDVIQKYGEENFYISFSGGKDSTSLHYLIDEAIPNNRIPRVYCDTGIEYDLIKKFVYEMKSKDDRIYIIKPTKNVKSTLEQYGYPFKSKEHSHVLDIYQRNGIIHSVKRYLNDNRGKFKCPDCLKYQFTSQFNLYVSDKCCLKLKKEPFKKWQKENNKTITITGMMSSEGGTREAIKSCIITDNKGNINKFHPLIKVSNEWEDWYIQSRNIQLCELYYPPYSFERTGCKGCPYALKLEEQLEVMERLLPSERKQCELIWKPVYEEYRRIGYRLKKQEQPRLF